MKPAPKKKATIKLALDRKATSWDEVYVNHDDAMSSGRLVVSRDMGTPLEDVYRFSGKKGVKLNIVDDRGIEEMINAGEMDPLDVGYMVQGRVYAIQKVYKRPF